jgi:hypothetical protein
MKLKNYFLLFAGFLIGCSSAFSQKKVGLDNWFNNEINKKTGLHYHYLWTDTAWSGFSRWGAIFTAQGACISHIGKPEKSSLKKLNVYIIVDPDTTTENNSPNYISPGDVKVIEAWVEKGGTLVLMANDGPNCEFTHLNMLAAQFGMVFNHVSLHPVINKDWEMGAFTSLPDHPMFKGVSKIYLKEISSLSLTGEAKPILSGNGYVFMAESRFGKGRVIAICDPWIYNEYIDHDRLPESFENRKAAENFTRYLIAE